MTLITYLTRIHFGDGVLEEAVRAEIAAAGLARPLIVTDPGLVAAGLVDRLRSAIPDAVAVAVFSATPENPTEEAVRLAAEAYRGHGADGLIAIGGGSPIDLAKAAGLALTHEGPLADYSAVEGGGGRIRKVMPPLIAIPTTAGTGSEVGRGTVITVDDGRKLALISPHLIPTAAICDPTLTIGLPEALTAGTGMDALAHCIETFIATSYNPPADGIALDGLTRIAGNIERAMDNGADIAARREMMAGAMNGALAFQKGLGGVHAASHALGALRDRNLHHGTLNAVMLPHVLAFNAPAAGERYKVVKAAMGLGADADLPEALLRLSERIRLPTTLGAMGVRAEDVPEAALRAEKDHTNGTNPRCASAEDYRRLMTAAL